VHEGVYGKNVNNGGLR